MKIVVLDGYAANPGDLSWAGVEALGELVVYDRTAPEDVMSRIAGAEIVLTNKVPFDRARLERAKELKYIGVLATGYNIIDTAAARELGIVVTNIPAYSTDSVVQMVFALLLEICLHVEHHNREVHAGRWSNNPDFCFWDGKLIELAGKTLGIIGYGSIGHRVAQTARTLGMNVIAWTRTPAAGPGVRITGRAAGEERRDFDPLPAERRHEELDQPGDAGEDEGRRDSDQYGARAGSERGGPGGGVEVGQAVRRRGGRGLCGAASGG